MDINGEVNINSLGHEVAYGGVQLWLLPLSYEPLKGQWLTARPARSIQF